MSFYKQFVIHFLQDYFCKVPSFLNKKASVKLKSSVLFWNYINIEFS